MNTYRVQLKIHSPLATPLQGDTLFGHICWGIRYHEGEDALLHFLSAADNGQPGLIISNAFPKGMLPVPLLDPPAAGSVQSITDYIRYKQQKKMRFLPADVFFDPNTIFSHTLLQQKLSSAKPGSIKILRTHNTINRFTGSVNQETGGLYSTEETWFTGKDNIVDVYTLFNGDQATLNGLFSRGLENGYGADTSTGKGHLTVEKVEPIDFPRNGNRCLCLGAFVPSPADKLENLRANIFTKYGKLGSFLGLGHNPFKAPVIFYTEGSTFSAHPAPSFVGCLLKDIHRDKRIRHHAYAPVIPFRVEGEA